MRKPVDIFTGYQVSRAEAGADPEVRGKHGSILPYDADTLAVFAEGAHRLRKLMRIAGASLFTEGEGEGTVHDPNAGMTEAAAIIGAKMKRAVSETAKERLHRIGAA